jgi:hypothetical protein
MPSTGKFKLLFNFKVGTILRQLLLSQIPSRLLECKTLHCSRVRGRIASYITKQLSPFNYMRKDGSTYSCLKRRVSSCSSLRGCYIMCFPLGVGHGLRTAHMKTKRPACL